MPFSSTSGRRVHFQKALERIDRRGRERESFLACEQYLNGKGRKHVGRKEGRKQNSLSSSSAIPSTTSQIYNNTWSGSNMRAQPQVGGEVCHPAENAPEWSFGV